MLGMAIWNPFRRKAPLEEKAFAGPDLEAIFGIVPTTSGVTVNRETALRVPAVASAIRLLSEAAATLDVTVRQTAGETFTDIPDHPAAQILSGHVNGWTSGFELTRDLMIEALTRDAGGMAWINRPTGETREIIHYAQGVMNVDCDQATREPTFKIDNAPVAASDVIHLRSPFGKAPLSLALDAIAEAVVMGRHSTRTFSRGAKPSGALKFPKGMGEEAVKKTRTAWRATHEGDDAGGRTAILYDGTEFTPFQLSSVDAQFLELRSFVIVEIARAFRVPPSMLFEMERATWNNVEHMGREFLSYSLEPWLRTLEAAYTRALLTDDERADGLRIYVARDDLTRADLATRATTINSLVAARVLSPNEGRAWLGLPPRDGGDTFMNPNITPLQEAA